MKDKHEVITQEDIKQKIVRLNSILLNNSNELENAQQILDECEREMSSLKVSVIMSKLKDYIDSKMEFINYDKLDEFMKNEFWNPQLQRLNELTGLENKVTQINAKESLKFCKRLLEKGRYTDTAQGKRFETTALKKVFDIVDQNFTKADVLVLNKEVLNADYSARTGMIIEAMRQAGDEKNPVIIENRGMTITKYGIECSSKAIALFNYLLGQFVENGANTTKILLNEEFYRGLNSSNGRGNDLADIKSQLGAISSQYIYIDDGNNKDKATKKIQKNLKQESIKRMKLKGTNLIIIKYTEVEGQDAIIFNIPLMKMFCSHNQHARLVDAKAITHWRRNPRIPLITRELGKLARNRGRNTLTIERLLINIGEWDRYKEYSDKKKYFQRLNKDIYKAIEYMETKKNFSYAGCTVTTFKSARIIYE